MTKSWFESRSSCPACRSVDLFLRYESSYTDSPLKDYLVDFYSPQGGVDFDILTGANYALQQCAHCSLLFQREIPGDRLMQTLYESWIEPSIVFEKQSQSGVEHYGQHASEILAIGHYLGRRPADLTVLDFGMGWGDWLLMAKAFGFRAFGMEISHSRVEHGRSLGLEMIDWDAGKEVGFDFINTEQVFEHLSEPLETLKGLCQMLNPRGLLKISVPTAHRVERRLSKMDWDSKKGSKLSLNFIAPLEHIQYFQRTSLIEMARLAGMEIVKIPVRTQISAASGWTSLDRILRNIGLPIVRNFTNLQNYIFLSPKQ